MITAMNEILTLTLTALAVLAGLAALVRYASNDVFSGPIAGPRSECDVPGLRATSRRLTLP